MERWEIYEGAAKLPYVREDRPGSDHLLVCFPGLRADQHQGAPATRMRDFLPEVEAHRIYVGADRDLYVGPKRQLAGARTGVELISREAERLGIPPERVLTMGTSMGAIAALFIGLGAGAGRIVAGAPAVRIATDFTTFSRGSTKLQSGTSLRRVVLRLAASPDPPSAEVFLDRLLFDTAAAATSPATVHLFVGPRDVTHESVQLFARSLEGHAHLTPQLRVVDYGTHPRIGRFFLRYFVEVAKEAGLVRQPTGETA